LFGEFNPTGEETNKNTSFETIKTVAHEYKLIENEEDMFSVALENGTMFNNLRYGTNVFHRRIDFGVVPFIDDEYMVFFDTYGNGEFVFGYDKTDLEGKTHPTLGAVVSMPMLMNKTRSGFTVVLPIHTHFNSLKKYNIGVPCKNRFRLQVVGRHR
jgi:hypothetical protein